MSVKSKSQFRFMKMMEHNPEMAKKEKISPDTAKEMTESNVGKKEYSKLPEKKKPKFEKLKKLIGGK